MPKTTAPRRAHRRLALPVIVAGGLSSLLLAFSLTPTFSALTASITNNSNTAGTGTLVMEEYDGSNALTCKSSDGTNNALATCSLDKYGADLGMLPGASKTVNVSIKNSSNSSVAASAFTLTPTACAQSNNGSYNGTATDLCTQYNVKISSGATTIYNGTPADLAQINLLDATHLNKASIAVGESVPFTIVVTLNGAKATNTTTQNTYQGLKIAQSLTWAFQA